MWLRIEVIVFRNAYRRLVPATLRDRIWNARQRSLRRIKRLQRVILERRDQRLLRGMTAYLLQQERVEAARVSHQMNERPIEYAFALLELNRMACRTVLDVGTGRSAFPALLRQCGFQITASDSKGSYWEEFSNRHIWVHANDITAPALSGPFDAVVAVSCVEHIPDAGRAIRGMVEVLRPGGLLVLTFPYSHSEYIEDVYVLPEADTFGSSIPYCAQSFSENEIRRWKTNLQLTELRRAYFRGWSGDFWRTGTRLEFAAEVHSASEANGLCISLVSKAD